MHELDPDGALVHYNPRMKSVEEVFGPPMGDPDDPILASDLESLDAHEAQDAEYDREHAADVMLEVFLAGIAASDGLGIFGMDDPAFALGETVGAMIRGAIALNPALAPLWDALVDG